MLNSVDEGSTACSGALQKTTPDRFVRSCVRTRAERAQEAPAALGFSRAGSAGSVLLWEEASWLLQGNTPAEGWQEGLPAAPEQGKFPVSPPLLSLCLSCPGAPRQVVLRPPEPPWAQSRYHRVTAFIQQCRDAQRMLSRGLKKQKQNKQTPKQQLHSFKAFYLKFGKAVKNRNSAHGWEKKASQEHPERFYQPNLEL